jgi:hypothetical protein
MIGWDNPVGSIQPAGYYKQAAVKIIDDMGIESKANLTVLAFRIVYPATSSVGHLDTTPQALWLQS